MFARNNISLRPVDHAIQQFRGEKCESHEKVHFDECETFNAYTAVYKQKFINAASQCNGNLFQCELF